MERTEFITELYRIFALNGLDTYLNDERAEQFYRLTEHLLSENARYNLTAVTEERAVIFRHLADSVCVAPYLPSGSLIDVGCGAGFPSLPLAIVRPDIRVTALDSTKKRTDYVAGCAELLGLSNISVICARAEDAAKSNLRESFDAATARGVAELRVLAELCLPFVRVGGLFLAMKGKNADEEATAARAGIGTLGAKNEARHDLMLTNGEETLERPALLYRKERKTPDAYPRAYARICKKPL